MMSLLLTPQVPEVEKMYYIYTQDVPRKCQKLATLTFLHVDKIENGLYWSGLLAFFM
jgi:hypothetical protein